MNERNLTAYKLAQEVEIDNKTISNYLNEKKSTLPDLEIVIKLADYFNVSILYLLGETEAKSVKDTAICNELHINDWTINNLKKIKEINDIRENNRQKIYKNLLADVLLNPDLYKTLLKHLDIIVNTESKKEVDNALKENYQAIYKKHNLQYEDYVDILLCQKFLEKYNEYIARETLPKFSIYELENKERELTRKLKEVKNAKKEYTKNIYK